MPGAVIKHPTVVTGASYCVVDPTVVAAAGAGGLCASHQTVTSHPAPSSQPDGGNIWALPEISLHPLSVAVQWRLGSFTGRPTTHAVAGWLSLGWPQRVAAASLKIASKTEELQSREAEGEWCFIGGRQWE